jgi:hypothetical protein
MELIEKEPGPTPFSISMVIKVEKVMYCSVQFEYEDYQSNL